MRVFRCVQKLHSLNVRTKVFTSIETVEGIIFLINSPSTKHSMSIWYILKDKLLVFKHELDNHLLGHCIVVLYIE